MRFTTGLLGLCLVAGAAGAADLYKWKDANGVTHYSESPPPGQKYEARRIDSSGGVGPSEEEAPAAAKESPQCTQARQNLKVLSDSRTVMQDTDGDGKADAKLDESQREAQRNLADASVKAYCPQTGG